MSFVYSFYNCVSPFPQSLFGVYSQHSIQNPITPIILTQCQPQFLTAKAGEKFEPILVSATTCETITDSEKKPVNRKQFSVVRRQFSKKKDENFGWRNQNKDRNVISSILKGYAHYVLHDRGMVKFIEQLAKKRDLENGVSSFYQFMADKFPSKKSYVGLRYIQDVLTNRPSANSMTYIMGVTLRHYLQYVYPITIAQGIRLKKKARLALLRKARTISKLLFTE